MLRLWPNQLMVTLGATHIALLYRSGITKKTLMQRELAVIDQAEHAGQAALQALARMLTELALPANTALHISLSGDLVRYLVLPAATQGIAQSEKLAYAQAAFREVYGVEALDWVVQCDNVAPTKPAVCAAIPQTLLETLTALAHAQQFKLVSVQPYFVHAFNRLRSSIKQASGVMVVVEHSRLLLANLQQGVCTQLRVQTMTSQWQQQLQATLARSVLLDDSLNPVAYVYAPVFPSSQPIAVTGWEIKPLRLPATPSQLAPPYAMLEVMT